MSTQFARGVRLRELMDDQRCVVAPGSHDAMSALMIGQAGYSAVYVGSYATAASRHALPDVGLLTLTEIAAHARSVVDAAGVPVIADAEAGFYEPANVWRTVREFEDAGVAAIHFEDHAGGKHTPVAAGLAAPETVERKIRAACEARRDDKELQIIARTDALWVGDDVDDAVVRMQRYAAAGADIVFPTGIASATLKEIRADLPAPVMVIGDLPNVKVEELHDAGANLVVLFNFSLGAMTRGLSNALAAFADSHDMRRMAEYVEPQEELEARLDYAGYTERATRYRRAET